MHLPLAVFGLGTTELFGFVIPVFGMMVITAIVVVRLHFKHQRERLWHETMRTAMEKGLPIPSEPETGRYRRQGRHGPLHDVRAGLILLAISGGLFAGLAGNGLPGQSLIGAYVTGAIGIAMLLNAVITAIFAPKSNDSDLSKTP